MGDLPPTLVLTDVYHVKVVESIAHAVDPAKGPLSHEESLNGFFRFKTHHLNF